MPHVVGPVETLELQPNDCVDEAFRPRSEIRIRCRIHYRPRPVGLDIDVARCREATRCQAQPLPWQCVAKLRAVLGNVLPSTTDALAMRCQAAGGPWQGAAMHNRCLGNVLPNTRCRGNDHCLEETNLVSARLSPLSSPRVATPRNSMPHTLSLTGSSSAHTTTATGFTETPPKPQSYNIIATGFTETPTRSRKLLSSLRLITVQTKKSPAVARGLTLAAQRSDLPKHVLRIAIGSEGLLESSCALGVHLLTLSVLVLVAGRIGGLNGGFPHFLLMHSTKSNGILPLS